MEDGNIEIEKYYGDESELVIPEILDGKSVTSIGDETFYLCIKLTSITIPDSVTYIGDLWYILKTPR